jgi:hypothetical protein
MLLGRNGAAVDVVGQPVHRTARDLLAVVNHPTDGVSAPVKRQKGGVVADRANCGALSCSPAYKIVRVGRNDDVGPLRKRLSAKLRLPRNTEAFGRNSDPVEYRGTVRTSAPCKWRRGDAKDGVLPGDGLEYTGTELLLTAEENVHLICSRCP